MKMFLTRLGFGSKIVVTGDITRSICRCGHGRLAGGHRDPGDIDGIHFAVLDSSDVVRHRLVSDIVDAYDRFESTRTGIPSGQSGTAAGGPAALAPAVGFLREQRLPHARGRRRNDVDEYRDLQQSGMEVSDEDLISVARFVIARMDVHPAAELSMCSWIRRRWPTSTCGGWICPSHRRHVLPDGRTRARWTAGRPGTRPSILGDIVLCPSVRARAGREGRHSLDHELAAAHRARRPAPPRLRPRRAGGGEGDVRLQNQLLADWYEDLRRAEREAQLAARDQQLLGKAGFFDGTEQ